MKTIIIFLILFIGMNCYADKYKKIESQVKRYEQIAVNLEKCIETPKVLSNKKTYNKNYDKFVEIGFMLEEIIIIEGNLTFDDLIVPMSERKGTINNIGKRRYNKSVDELIKVINVKLTELEKYTDGVIKGYGKRE